jgi:hypothetical protein
LRPWHVRSALEQFHGIFRVVIDVAATPSDINAHIAADGPPSFLQALQECREARLAIGIVRTRIHQHADAPHALGLLRAGHHGHAAAPPSPAMNARLFIQ